MSPKAASCHQCLELNKLTQQHFSPAPINLQGYSFPQASSMENPARNVGSSLIWALWPRERAIYLCLFVSLVGFLFFLIF